MSVPYAAASLTSSTATSEQPRLSWWLFSSMWLAFWSVLFLLGMQEYRWLGGHELSQLAVRYATAAAVSTAIGVSQLRRGPGLDALLGQPVRWFARLWRRLPLEVVGFGCAMYAVPRAFCVLTGQVYDDDNWQEIALYDTAKFLLFYFLAGGLEFGIHSYSGWAREKVRVAEHAQLVQEAQLTQLTQQLQPHFLFNGLNTVSALIYSDPAMADKLLGRLATLLRAATTASKRSEQPLKDELLLLKAYADIMTERYRDRVSIEWAIDSATEGCLVPTMSLQPLLENCFCHVVEKRRAPTRIVVRAQRHAQRLRIEIEDDGEPATRPPVFGVGLGNLESRLESLHSEDASLVLLPLSDGGTVVRVEIPCVS